MRILNLGGNFTVIGKSLDDLDWQESIISRYNPTVTLPLAPLDGDRYLSVATAHGWNEDSIYEWTGLSWYEIVPDEGFITWCEEEDTNYMFDGTDWNAVTALVSHNSLTGLQGGTTNQFYHLSQLQHSYLTTNLPLTASRLLGSNASKEVTTASLSAFVAGTTDQVTITDDTAGGIIVSLPQNISTDADLIFGTITASGYEINGVVKIQNQSDHPDPPDAGYVYLYSLNDTIYVQDDAGNKTALGSGGGAGSFDIVTDSEADPITIIGGDTLHIVGGGGINVSHDQGTDTVTIEVDTVALLDEWLPMYGIDETDDDYYFFGYAEVNSDKWRIKRIDKLTAAIAWAYGESGGSAAWSNRSLQSYGEI